MSKKFSRNRILLCTSTTVPFNAGDGKNAYNFALSLTKNNQKTVLLSLNKSLLYPFKTIIKGVLIFRAPYFNANIFQKLLSRFIIIPYFIYFLLRSDIVIIYGKILGYSFLILLGKILRKRVIFRSTLFGFDDFNTLLNHTTKGRFRKKIFNLIDNYYSLTPAFTKAYLNHFESENKIFESFQGVDTSIFYPVNNQAKNKLKQKLNLPQNTLIIISVGFLIKRKGFDEIFEVLSQINIPFLYLIVGDHEPSSLMLKKKRKEMKRLYEKGDNLLNNKVSFIGPKSNIEEYLQASDILLINSSMEGLPNVLLEGMACGIASLVRGISGLVDYLVFPGKNAEIFSTQEEMHISINKLFLDIKYRNDIAKNASIFVKENCKLDHITYKFLKRIIKD